MKPKNYLKIEEKRIKFHSQKKKFKNDLKEEKILKVLEFKNDGRSKKLH